MITTGKYYSTLTGDERGNAKYSVELKKALNRRDNCVSIILIKKCFRQL